MGHQTTASEFQTTRWTLILRARSNTVDLSELLSAYHGPIVAYLEQKVRNRHDAEELSQEFICRKFLEGHLLDKADRERGKFRSFLLSSLNRFVIDIHRQTRGRENQRPRTISTADITMLDEAHAPDDPVVVYNREYFRMVLDTVRQRLEERCRVEGMDRHWIAYEARLLNPVLHGSDPQSIDSLAKALQLSAARVSHMIESVKRKSVQVLREVVAETIDDPDDLEEEIDLLWATLAP